MEVKMAATTRILQLILKKLSLGHLTELFRRDNNTTDMICNQQGTSGHNEFAITIMLVCHDPETSGPSNFVKKRFTLHTRLNSYFTKCFMVTQYLKATARKK